MLAAAYHLGTRSATAQAPDNSVVSTSMYGSNEVAAVTANGDTYRSVNHGSTWTFQGNVFAAPMPVHTQNQRSRELVAGGL